MPSITAGDVGTEITLDCGSAIGTATVLKIMAMKPDYTKVEWSAILSGTTALKYSTVAGDMDLAGTYTLQAYIEMPGWKGSGDPVSVEVKPRVGG